MKKLNSWICLLLLVVAAGILPACSSNDDADHGKTKSDAATAAQHGEDQPPEQQGLPENPQGDAPSDGDAPTDDHDPEGESTPAPVDSRG